MIFEDYTKTGNVERHLHRFSLGGIVGLSASMHILLPMLKDLL